VPHPLRRTSTIALWDPLPTSLLWDPTSSLALFIIELVVFTCVELAGSGDIDKRSGS
jgi:hypothetical protein